VIRLATSGSGQASNRVRDERALADYWPLVAVALVVFLAALAIAVGSGKVN
jgi:hypothetical protein